MQNVGFTDEVSDADARAVLTAARTACVQLVPFELIFDAVEVREEAVAFRSVPPEPVCRLRDVVRAAIETVRGQIPDAPEHAHGFQPHVSVAYANADGPSDAVVEAVRPSMRLRRPSRCVRRTSSFSNVTSGSTAGARTGLCHWTPVGKRL